MSSLNKMLYVLDLFQPGHPHLSVEEIGERLRYTLPTTYRYVRALCDAGLLNRLNGRYALGARVIELDYYVRSSDPLLMSSADAMQDLSNRYGCDTQLLSLFGFRVIAVYHASGEHSVTVSFGRGRPMPLFRGAGSKAIVAFQSPARRRRIFEKITEEEAANALPWPDFNAAVNEIKAAGCALSLGELDDTNVGVAVPVFGPENCVSDGLVMVFGKERYQLLDKELLISKLRQASQTISERLTGERTVSA